MTENAALRPTIAEKPSPAGNSCASERALHSRPNELLKPIRPVSANGLSAICDTLRTAHEAWRVAGHHAPRVAVLRYFLLDLKRTFTLDSCPHLAMLAP